MAVDIVAMKLPTFWVSSPAACFAQAEAQFVPCTMYLGCVPPLLEVALRKFFPLLSVFCSSRPCCSLPLHDVIFPSHFGSAPRSSSFPHLPLCCAYCPPIVLHSCHMSRKITVDETKHYHVVAALDTNTATRVFFGLNFPSSTKQI